MATAAPAPTQEPPAFVFSPACGKHCGQYTHRALRHCDTCHVLQRAKAQQGVQR